MTATEQLLGRSAAYETSFDKAGLPMRPGLRVAIVACMDARVNPYGIFGLVEGEAHVIRNAGGAVTDDVIRSLVISQRLLGTSEVIVVHHADCGMRTFKEEEFNGQLQADTGIRPPWASAVPGDAGADVGNCLALLRASPFLLHKDAIRGFVYDESSGKLTEQR